MKIKAKIAAFLLAATTLASTLIGCSAYNNPEKYLNIPDFKEVSVAKEDIDEELKKQINDILESLRKADYVEVEDKDYQIKLGDSVNITYEGKPTDEKLDLIDDVLKGMTNKDDEAGYDLVIGSDSFIGEYKDKDGNLVNEGFEEQLKGHKKGDEVDVIVTFPDDYKEKELQGVEVNFKVKINSISTLEGIDVKNDAQEVKVSYTFIDPFEKLYKDETDANYEAKVGDKLNINYTGKPTDTTLNLPTSALDKLKNDSEKGYNFVIGSDSLFTEDFSNGLLGAKTGDKKTVTFTFPEDYSVTALQKVEVSIDVTVNTVTESYERGNGDFIDKTLINAEFEKVEGEAAEIEFIKVFKDGTFTVNFAKLDENETLAVAWKAVDLISYLDKQELYYEETFHVVAPDDPKTYGKYAGKDLGLTMTVSSITTVPEWNDATVEEYTTKEYNKVDEYEAYLLKMIKGDLVYKALSTDIHIKKYPKAELKEAYKNNVDQKLAETFGDISGMTQKELDAAIKEAEEAGKFNYAQVRAEAQANAKVSVKERLVLEYLFEKYDIEVSKDEYKKRIEEDFETYYYYYYTYYQIQTAEDLEKYFGKDYFMLQYQYEALIEYLGENCDSIVTVK